MTRPILPGRNVYAVALFSHATTAEREALYLCEMAAQDDGAAPAYLAEAAELLALADSLRASAQGWGWETET